MSIVGHVESVWRYPVKSMRGEKLDSAFVGFAGVFGDRLYAFKSSAAVAGFPFLTAREAEQLLLHQPRFRDPDLARQPSNLAEAQHLAPGLTPLYPDLDDLTVDVETPEGHVLAIDDPNLIERLRKAKGASGDLSVLRSDRAMTDCRPVSLISSSDDHCLEWRAGPNLGPQTVSREHLRGSRRRRSGGRLRWPDTEDRFESANCGARARSALQDDYARSGHGA